MRYNNYILILLSTVVLLMSMNISYAQYSISGTVFLNKEEGADQAEIILDHSNEFILTDRAGNYEIKDLPNGVYHLQVFNAGYKTALKKVEIYGQNVELDFQLEKLSVSFDQVTVEEEKANSFGVLRLKPVEGTAIYASKKSDVIFLEDLSVNLSTNNSRQMFSKVSGIHVWESDGAGIQLGVGGRGLSPSRTSNFNTRQNGYDISADALGYPESYYSPPSQLVERIEVVRGAASLQYGTQFGGFLNFKLKDPVSDQKIQLNTQQSIGSFGFFNSYNELSGTSGKWGYLAMFQYKRGDGWRDNAGFDQRTGYGKIQYKPTSRTTVAIEHTYMNYVAQQPGGLTDDQFEEDATQSVRERNWFTVNWNLSALNIDHDISSKWKFNSRFFMLNAAKASVGYMGNITRPDPDTLERNLLVDQYFNYGNETRFLYTYNIGSRPSNWLIGARYYKGMTQRRQGIGSANSDADFEFSNADENRGLLDNWKNAFVPNASEYDFPSENISVFSEHILPITDKLSITPGARFEYIATIADGYYDNFTYDIAGEILEGQRNIEYRSNYRSFILLGLGASFKHSETFEMYANISQNYRGLTFNDIRVVNPSLIVDENLKDETGYSSDIGIRGQLSKYFSYDGGLFFIWYQNKIANIQESSGKRLRTNAPDARMYGVEGFAEWDFWKHLISEEGKSSMSVFTNFSLVDARYVNTDDPQFEGNKVEMAPPVIFRTGLSFKRNRFSSSLQFSYTSKHYAESSNAEDHPNPIFGEIPAYYIMDLSFKYNYKRYTTTLSINNMLDQMYFTRRADGYPGPGILPSDGRGIYFMIGAKF